MTKKLPIGLVLLFFTVGLFAQTIVSTTPENRKVILEEFTGINCVFCPDGHTIANQIKSSYPDDFFVINIHAGGFANPSGNQPDFRTPDGEAIRANWSVTSFPSGMVNRTTFSGGSPVQGRGTWASSTDQLVVQDSYVNVALEGSIDVTTNELTILVEAFYTGSSPEATNFLTVALMQNNTLGPQTGGNMGNMYNHQHRLVDIITPTFGEVITTTSAGSFVERTYTYSIPANYNGITAEIADMELVAFIAETNANIVSGNGTLPTFTGLTTNNDAELDTISEIPNTCFEEIGTTVTVKNLGANPITSLDITYAINGGTEATFNWTGEITTFQSENITLPAIPFTVEATNTFSVSIPNDENNSNNNIATSFTDTVSTAGTVILTILTDTWAEETSWEFLDSNGTVLESESYSGNANPSEGGDDNTEFVYVIDLPEDCITFNMFDTFGDGLTEGAGGFVSLEDANGVVVYPENGNFGAGFSIQFGSDGLIILDTDENVFESITMFPNPATDVLNIINAERASLEIYDSLGRRVSKVKKASKNENIDVSRMSQGVYIVKITLDGITQTMSFIKK